MIRFGPFQIDPRTWTLAREGQTLDLSPRLVEILGFVVARGGAIVTKEELLERFWPDVNVSDNTLTRAIADIRKAIGDHASDPQYLQTAARRGYRFVGTGSTDSTGSTAPLAADEDPFQAWVKGRLALDSLDVTRLAGAVSAFERAAAELPSYAPAHAGLANAYLLQFERTRSGSIPDRDLLTRATAAARRACAIDRQLGEAWSVLGYVLFAAGATEEAQAAARRACALEPENWRHQYRLAYATWGEERLRAVDRALTLMPGFAPLRMLAAMVFVARGALDRAERETRLGADAQRQQRDTHVPLPAVGFFWFLGMLLAARGAFDQAHACFEEEIAGGRTAHVYGREFAVNARVAQGFVHLAQDDPGAASQAFAGALAEASGHPKATVGMLAIAARTGSAESIEAARAACDRAIDELSRGERRVEQALVAAGARCAGADIDDALALVDRLLTEAPSGPAGWIVAIDPMLAPVRLDSRFGALLHKLAARAA